VKKRGHDANQWLVEASSALELALELSPDLVADFGPALVLELALDMAQEWVRALDWTPGSGVPQAARFALSGEDEEMTAARCVTLFQKRVLRKDSLSRRHSHVVG
jgi:hypothetical protein